MFSQGKRNDILEQLQILEKPHEYGENETLPQVGAKLRTDEKIGKVYSLSKNTIARYLRVQYLIQPLKFQLDNGKLPFIPAITISFLSENEQESLANCMESSKLSIDMKKADVLRKYSEKGKLDSDCIYRILSGTIAKKPVRTPTVKVSKVIYSKYFKPNQPAKEVQGIVEQALKMYFESQ
jgi:ParB family chromosome partitioning protein